MGNPKLPTIFSSSSIAQPLFRPVLRRSQDSIIPVGRVFRPPNGRLRAEGRAHLHTMRSRQERADWAARSPGPGVGV